MTPENLDKYSPDPDGPMIGVSWYDAAAYCNWLSEQEGLPKEVVLRAERRGRVCRGDEDPCRCPAADGLSPAHRGGMGVRLPGGGGDEPILRSLGGTARAVCLVSGQHSEDRAWPCGSCMPNDLGLFDMLGTCMNGARTGMTTTRPTKGNIDDNITIYRIINEKNPRLLRGGSFNYHPAYVRSASVDWLRPVVPGHLHRFPPLQDLPLSPLYSLYHFRIL